MTLDNATGLQVGQIFVLDQVDDENLVREQNHRRRGGGRNNNRVLQQFLRVSQRRAGYLRTTRSTRPIFAVPIVRLCWIRQLSGRSTVRH